MRRIDLMLQTNLRTTIQLVKGVLPKMQEQKWGQILVVAPAGGGMPARGTGLMFSLSKTAQSGFVLGAAEELATYGIAANTMWPAGPRDTAGNRMFRQFDATTHTKPDLFADAALAVVSADPASRTGQALSDEDVLRAAGITDFSKYALSADAIPE